MLLHTATYSVLRTQQEHSRAGVRTIMAPYLQCSRPPSKKVLNPLGEVFTIIFAWRSALPWNLELQKAQKCPFELWPHITHWKHFFRAGGGGGGTVAGLVMTNFSVFFFTQDMSSSFHTLHLKEMFTSVQIRENSEIGDHPSKQIGMKTDGVWHWSGQPDRYVQMKKKRKKGAAGALTNS